MLRRVEVGDLHGIAQLIAQDQAGVAQRCPRNLRPWQQVNLTFDFRLHLIGKAGRGGNQDHLRRRVVLRLTEQIGGDQPCIGAIIRNDQQLAGASRHVDRRSARHACNQRFCFRDPRVPRPANLGDCRDVARAERQGRDRLRSTNGPDAVKAAQISRQSDRRVDATAGTGRCHGDDLSDSRDPRRNREHE